MPKVEISETEDRHLKTLLQVVVSLAKARKEQEEVERVLTDAFGRSVDHLLAHGFTLEVIAEACGVSRQAVGQRRRTATKNRQTS